MKTSPTEREIITCLELNSYSLSTRDNLLEMADRIRRYGVEPSKPTVQPVKQLMAEYAQENCAWENTDYLLTAAYRYGNSASSHLHCLAFAMAEKIEQLSKEVEELKASKQ